MLAMRHRRPLVHGTPRSLLLDEPSPGLAPLVVRDLARVIRLLCDDGVTILLIEQNMKLAEEVADRSLIMVKGRIVYSGDAADFRAERRSDPRPLPDGCKQGPYAGRGGAVRPRDRGPSERSYGLMSSL